MICSRNWKKHSSCRTSVHPRRRKSSLRSKKRAKLRKTTTADELRDLLREVLTDNMLDNQPLNTDGKPAVILVIGVNGVGKTTSIGKLAARYVNEGKKVMLSAADTFQAQRQLISSKSGLNVPVRTSFATARAQTRRLLCSTPSRRPRHAAAISSSWIRQAVCTTRPT